MTSWWWNDVVPGCGHLTVTAINKEVTKCDPAHFGHFIWFVYISCSLLHNGVFSTQGGRVQVDELFTSSSLTNALSCLSESLGFNIILLTVLTIAVT